MIQEQVLFSRKECEFILNSAKDYYRSKIVFQESKSSVSNRRTSYESTIGIDGQLKKLFLEKLKAFGVKSLPKHVKIVRYSEGAEFDKHKDTVRGFDYRYRSISIQLNDTYDNGELKIWEPDKKEYIVSKKLGNTVIFNSEFSHQVVPPTAGVRYSAVLWLTLENMGESKGLI